MVNLRHVRIDCNPLDKNDIHPTRASPSAGRIAGRRRSSGHTDTGNTERTRATSGSSSGGEEIRSGGCEWVEGTRQVRNHAGSRSYAESGLESAVSIGRDGHARRDLSPTGMQMIAVPTTPRDPVREAGAIRSNPPRTSSRRPIARTMLSSPGAVCLCPVAGTVLGLRIVLPGSCIMLGTISNCKGRSVLLI